MDQEAHRLLTSISCQHVSNRYLKLFTEDASTTYCGRLFQCGITQWLKKYFRTCSLARGINSFMLWPLSVLTVGDNWKKVALSTMSLPFKIFLSLYEIPVTQASLLMWKQFQDLQPFIIRRDLIPLPSWLPSAGLSPNTRCLWPNMVTKPAHNTPYRTWMNEWFIWYCNIAAGLYSSWKLSLSIFPNLFRIVPNETRKPAKNWDNVGLIWRWSCDRCESSGGSRPENLGARPHGKQTPIADWDSGWEREWVLGRGSEPRPHQLGGLESAVSFPSRVQTI